MSTPQSFADRFPCYMTPESIAFCRKVAAEQRERRGRLAETRDVVRAIEASLAMIEPDAAFEPFVGSAS